MTSLIADVHAAFAWIRRNRAFAASAILILSVGIGLTTAVASAVYGVLLRPLPYPDVDRLVRVSEEHPGATAPRRERLLSNVTYYAWTESPRTVEWLSPYGSGQFTIELPDGPDHLEGAVVSTTLLPMLGARPMLGRLFLPAEGKRGADTVVVLSDRLWRQRFGADPQVIGRTIRFEGRPFTIVGVVQPGFSFPDRHALFWKPFDEVTSPEPRAPGAPPRITTLRVLARLRPGVTTAQAASEGTARARSADRGRFADLQFGVGGPVTVRVTRLAEEMTTQVRPALLALAAAMGLLLLITCANVASLFLSQGVTRQRELAVRAALGASQFQLFRQLVTEAAAISSIGVVLGIGFAWALLHAAAQIQMDNLPRMDEVRFDTVSLVVAALAGVFSATITGVLPARLVSRVDVFVLLHSGTWSSSRVRGQRRLLTAEVTFALVLLVNATLMTRSFGRLLRVDPGYTPDSVVVATIFAPSNASDMSARVSDIVRRLLERVRAMPGVLAAGAGNMAPLDNTTFLAAFPSPSEAQNGAGARVARAVRYAVTPGYAEALRLRLRAGRLFDDADRGRHVRPWIVNEEFARLFLPHPPVGFQWQFKGSADVNEIVGLVANVLKEGSDREPQPEVFLPADVDEGTWMRAEVVARTQGDPARLSTALRETLIELDPTVAIDVTTLSRRVAASFDQPRVASTVMMSFAALALSLTALGLYGVLSYSVHRRTPELGLRKALGAGSQAVMTLVLQDLAGILVAGCALGIPAAYLTGRALCSLLFGVVPSDPGTYVVSAAVLAVVVVMASVVPTWRAVVVDPMVALREE